MISVLQGLADPPELEEEPDDLPKAKGEKPVKFPSQGNDLWIGAFFSFDFFSKETVHTRLAVQRTSCVYEQICPNCFGSGRDSMFSTPFPDVFCIPVSPAAASSQESYIRCEV